MFHVMSDGPFVLTKEQLLGDVAIESPRAAELLGMYGLHCISCFASSFDSLEIGAKVHGMSDVEIDEMIAEINREIAKQYENEHKN